MKQKAQWLSQVRMRSKTAEETSTPEGLARVLVDLDQARQIGPGALDQDLEVVGVTELLEIDDVARFLTVEGEELRHPRPSRPGLPATPRRPKSPWERT